MRIAFHMPLKPMGHPNPSGDLIIGSELYAYLKAKGHDLFLTGNLRTRWIFLKPWKLPHLLAELRRATRQTHRLNADVWLTYHSYYKAPDLLGPHCARQTGIPYTLFQGIYSTKRQRQLMTALGFYLNRYALQQADLVFTNKRRDHHNLTRLIAPQRLVAIQPGIRPSRFNPDSEARIRLRHAWQARQTPVLLSVAMLRPGVKTQGVEIVIRTCQRLADQGVVFKLVVAGDGACRDRLERLARELLPGRVRFIGQIPRRKLYEIYSAADLFVFPGIDESLGMVYLEAQSCGLPVVAFNAWGASEAVIHKQTGLLSPPTDLTAFDRHLKCLLADSALRQRMGKNAYEHVRRHHDLETNYAKVEDHLKRLVSGAKKNGLSSHKMGDSPGQANGRHDWI